MQDNKTDPTEIKERQQHPFSVDRLLFIFLLIGWLIIFLFATLGLYRVDQDWLPINPVVRASANYGVDAADAPRLAQVKPEIVEAVKQDEKIRESLKTPTLLTDLIDITATPTPSTTPTVVQSPLTVDVGGPYEGEEGSEISLVADNFNSVLGYIPGGVSYVWDLNGDGIYDDGDGPTASVIFYDEGDYPISVKAIDLLGREAIDTTVANVINVAPIIEMGPDVYTNEGQTVYFTATASDPGRDILFYQWDFGDGSIGVNNTLNPQHIFGDDGEYVVTLRVRDNDGGESEATLMAYVGNLPPDADAGPDQVVDEGSPLTLRGEATDPAGDNDTLTFAWDLDYDGNNFEPDIEGQQITTTYINGPANIVAALRVNDEDGGETIDTVNITVNNVPPVITSVSNNGPVGEGSFLNITVSATDVGDDSLTYAFDWNNDDNYESVLQSNSASNIWPDQGQYTVGIRVDDGDGGEAFSSTVVSTFNLTPTAVAQTTQRTYFEGSAVTFNGSESSDPGINDVLTYAWDFGDGSTGSGVNTTHTYADNGVYTATLTVTDDSGAVDRDSLNLTILNANPTANAGADRDIDEGENVEIIVISSEASDPGADTLTFEWDFDYDGVNFITEATGESARHVYPELDGPEEKTVALRVRDDDYPAPTDNGGEIGEFIDVFKLNVKNVPPSNIDGNGPYKGIVTEPITFTAETATDIPGDTLTYEWDFDYRDNSFTRDATGQIVTNIWNIWGEFPIALRVSDEDGGESEVYETTVNVNAVPVADAGDSYDNLEGVEIVFDGSASQDPDGDQLTYIWNFGDGTGTKTGITATHVFTDNGTYTTTLTVRDSDGDQDTDSVVVNIFNANPIITSPLTNRTVNEGESFTLVGSAIDPGAGDTLTYAWDFDYDGVTFDEDATVATTILTYPNGPATYTVALRVRDDDYPYPITSTNGITSEIGEALGTFIVTVNNINPIAEAGGSYYNVEGQPVALTGSAIDVASDLLTLTYAWDLNNNGVFDTLGQTVTNTWPSGGVYTVALRVTDIDGGVGVDTAEVIINSIPTAEADGPYTGSEGIPITLDGSGSFDPDNDPLTYTWDFGDGLPRVTGPNPSVAHVYFDNGNYVATLTVDDGRGGIASDQANVTINNLPPTVVIGGPYNGDEKEIITFDGSRSTDTISDTLSYFWDFGDGSSTATGAVVNHTYDDNGTYTVTLTVTDDDGGISVATTDAVIANVNPIAEAGGPYQTTINVSIPLIGTGSDVADPITFDWDLDNDGTFETPGQNTTNTWTTPGLKTVTLRVTDDDGGFATDTATVDVGSPPVANAGGPYTADENISITFDGSASSDPDGDALSYNWDFGDGSIDTGATVNHAYADNGTYVVTLTVNDGRGGVSTAQANVTITNVAPTANIGGPYSGDEGQNIDFDGSGSSDPSPVDDASLTYSWDFGDGITGSGSTVSHQYDDNGTFNVTLTVTDKDGASDSDSITVNIANLPPQANAGGPYGNDEGTVTTFDASGSSDPGPIDTLTYEWDFGDGSPVATGPVVSHTYDDSGDYTVVLRVTDNDGAEDTDTVNLTIVNLPPTADAGGPYNTTIDTPVTLSGSGSDIPADEPLSFDWDLDNNGDFEISGQSVNFTQSTTGTYTVVLRVSDDDGGETTATTTVEVNSLLPLIWLSLPFIWARRRKRKHR